MSTRLLALLPLVALMSAGCFSKDSDDDDDDDDGSTSGAPEGWGDGGSGDGGSGDGGSGDGGSGDGGSDGADGTDGADGADGGSSSSTTGAGTTLRGEMQLTSVESGEEWLFSIEGEQVDCAECTFSFEGIFRNDDFGDFGWTLTWRDVGEAYDYVYLEDEYYWGWGRAGGGYAAWFPGENWEGYYYDYEGVVLFE